MLLCFPVLPCRVTVIEAKELLGTFDGSLREYAARKLVSQGVKLRRVSGDSWSTHTLLPDLYHQLPSLPVVLQALTSSEKHTV